MRRLSCSDSTWRARKPTAALGLRGKYSGRRPPRPGSTPPSGRGGRRHLPVSSSHGSGRAGGDRAQCLPPFSFPSRAHRFRRRLLPRYYNNQQATARSKPLRRRPAPGAKNARLQARPNFVIAAQRGLRARSEQTNPDLIFRFLSSSPKGLIPKPEFCHHAHQAGSLRGRRTWVRLGQRQPLVGSKAVHAPSPA